MKKTYEKPWVRAVWIGLDEQIAQQNIGGMGATSDRTSGPPENFVKEQDMDWGGMHEETELPETSTVWEKGW